MAASLGTGFLKTEDHLETPDIQFHIQTLSADKPADGPHKFSGFTASVLQLRPESRASVTTFSKHGRSPRNSPKLSGNRYDYCTIVKGIQVARRIAQAEPLRSYITEEHAPGANIAMDDDVATLDWARRTSVTIIIRQAHVKWGLTRWLWSILNCA